MWFMIYAYNELIYIDISIAYKLDKIIGKMTKGAKKFQLLLSERSLTIDWTSRILNGQWMANNCPIFTGCHTVYSKKGSGTFRVWRRPFSCKRSVVFSIPETKPAVIPWEQHYTLSGAIGKVFASYAEGCRVDCR